jgi:WD40 repeat protein
MTSGKEIHRLTGHRDDVGRLLFSPNGRILASVGLTTYEHNTPNGGKATTGISDNRVHLWDMDSGKEIRQFVVPRQGGNDKPGSFSNGIAQVAFSHDGKHLAASATLAKDKHVRIWEVSTGEKVRDLPAAGGPLAFSADDKILATSGTGAIQLWDSRTGKKLEVAKGHQGSILGLAVSPDCRRVASAGVDGTVRLWEPTTGRELQRIVDSEDGAHRVTFWPDGRTLAISGTDKAIRLWDPAGGRETRRLQGNHEYWSTPTLSPDTKMVASCSSDGVICLWDSVTGKKQREWKAISTGYVGRLFFGPDSKTLYSWGDNTVRVWDPSTGQHLRQFFAGQKDRTYAAAFAPSGKWLACGGQEPTTVLYDLATGKEMYRLTGLPGAGSCLSFSADSRVLAATGWHADKESETSSLRQITSRCPTDCRPGGRRPAPRSRR